MTRLNFLVRARTRSALRDLADLEGATAPLLLAVIVGVGAGLGAVVFRELIDAFHDFFFTDIGGALSVLGRARVVLLPALGGLLVGPIVYFLAREAKGHGVPEVMLAVSEEGGRIRPRVAIVKSLASAICIGSGGSVGREGPIVQVGSALGSTLGQALRLSDNNIRLLVSCGAAGGISATFNAPIAGVFFALEIILRRFSVRNFSAVVLSSVVANVVSVPFLGDNPAFQVPVYRLESGWEIGLYALLGILAGVVAVAFIHVLYGLEDFFDALPLREYVKPALGGLAMGALGLWYADLFGVGYGGVNSALHEEKATIVLLLLVGLKLLATSVTIGSGGSGGVFAPSLFMGAMLGGSFGEVAHGLFPAVTATSGAYALVGMGAVFAGAARAPMTSIIILFEMTRDYRIILPLMTAVVVSTVVGQILSRESIYTVKLTRRGIDVQKEPRSYLMEALTVGEVMNRKPATVPADMTLLSLAKYMAKTGLQAAAVVGDDGRLLGMVTMADIQRRAEALGDDLRAADIATRPAEHIFPDQTLHRVLSLPDADEQAQWPVVDREDTSRLLGMLERKHIIGAYSRLASRREGEEHRRRMAIISQDRGTRLDTHHLGDDSPLVGKRLRDLHLPPEAVVVSIRRRGRTVIPRGDVVLRTGDQLTILMQAAAESATREALEQPSNPARMARKPGPQDGQTGSTG
jgi:CIC family chloride channel protein